MERLQSAVSGLALRQTGPCLKPPDPPKKNLCAGIPQGVYNLGLLGAKKDILAETRNNCRKETSATCPEHTKSPSW